MVYMGPVAPHWEMRSDFGDKDLIDGLRTRVEARLVLLPPHDPQFRRNRERVNRDAERENIRYRMGLRLRRRGRSSFLDSRLKNKGSNTVIEPSVPNDIAGVNLKLTFWLP